MVVVLSLILTLVVFRISTRAFWLVVALAVVILRVFGSSIGFAFLLLLPPVLLDLLLRHWLHPLLRHGIIDWDIYVVPDYPLLFAVVFWEMSLAMFL
jgi:hypothetical protein